MLLKRVLSVLISGLCILSCAACTSEPADSVPAVTGAFTVTALNVGKADALVLTTQNHTVVIDTGNRGDGKAILSCLSAQNITQIDYLFITHFDKDHVGGAVKLINSIPIGEIAAPLYEGNNSEYVRYKACLAENERTQTTLKSKLSFVLDDVLFEAYPAQKTTYKEEDNDFSIVIRAIHGDNTFLFAGDAEETRLAELPAQMKMPHTFLKVPHHGRENAGSMAFLESVHPAYAVITDSADEPCDPAVSEKLAVMDCQVFFTKEGTVSFTSDGQTITPSQLSAQIL